MICFWVISVEDDLFLGYQRRKGIVCGLSASKMTYVWAISVKYDLFLGYPGPGPAYMKARVQDRNYFLINNRLPYMMGRF